MKKITITSYAPRLMVIIWEGFSPVDVHKGHPAWKSPSAFSARRPALLCSALKGRDWFSHSLTFFYAVLFLMKGHEHNKHKWIAKVQSQWWWSSSSTPPIWDFQPPFPMHSKPDSRKLVPHLPPQHVYRVIFLRWVMKLKVVCNILECLPHLQPSLLFYLPELL